MKTRTFLTALLLMVTTSMFATQLSEYCDTPSGHLGNAEFGDRNGRMLLTITKVSDTELSVTVAPRIDSGCVFDYLSVGVLGGATYTCGENEGDVLGEYTVIIPFDPVPEEVTFSNIQWSHSGFEGNWIVYDITVPFDAACDVDLNDDVAPVVTTATVAATTSKSITLNVAATDEDNDGNDTGAITKFIINDAANGIVDLAATVEEDGTITLDDLNPLTTYNLAITAKDAAGNVSEGVTVTVATDDFSRISEYCERSIGHFGSESGESVIRLTITNVDETSFKVTVQPSLETGKVLDLVMINVNGFPSVTLGSNLDSETGYDSLLGEDEFTHTFTYASVADVPALITFSSIMWSFKDWGGNNMLQTFTVPFVASCEVEELNDAVLPVMVSASVESVSITSATLSLEATDTDDAGAATTVSSFILNDAENGVYNLTAKTDASGIATLTGLTAATTYNFTVAAKDENGNISENTVDVSFTTDEQPTSQILDDFEDGNCDGWGAQEGSNELTVVDNPYASGINTSSKVMCGGRSAASNNWAAAMLNGLNIDGSLFRYLHVMMYRDVIATVPNAKMSDAVGDIQPLEGQTMVTSEWQDVVYDVSAHAGSTISFLYYMYDRGALTEDAVVYLDNIELNNDPEPRTEDAATSIMADATTRANVRAANGTIYVKSATPAEVTIYTLTGSTVATTEAVESAQYALPSGCYLVRVGDEVFKVVL